MSHHDIQAALDTSVLMRLLTGEPAPQADKARAWLAEIERDGAKVWIPNLVVSETYFACQHHYNIPKAEVLKGLHTLLSQPTFVVHPDLLELLATKGLATAKPGFLDRLIHAEASTAGLTLVTFEKAAARLPRTHLLSD
ncbi:MAG TPA: PIN domain-containing protein [Luteolibacter sp.]|nr:PIN domain-containing protein [Luteolibacter sp.]